MNEFTDMAQVAPATPKLTDEQLAELLKAKPVDGEESANDIFISTDDEDETEDQKVN